MVMEDGCLAALAKHGEELSDTAMLLQFLEPWGDLEEYCDEILTCLRKNSSRVYSQANDRPEGMPSDAERKATLQAARLSRKP
ncbi:hypothetical protein MMC07_003208 [Pseudocyphellaria aurata]|nr:hypothetical protein [Pseudocyphellaria aurata]